MRGGLGETRCIWCVGGAAQLMVACVWWCLAVTAAEGPGAAAEGLAWMGWSLQSFLQSGSTAQQQLVLGVLVRLQAVLYLICAAREVTVVNNAINRCRVLKLGQVCQQGHASITDFLHGSTHNCYTALSWTAGSYHSYPHTDIATSCSCSPGAMPQSSTAPLQLPLQQCRAGGAPATS